MKQKTINQQMIEEKWYIIDAEGKRIGRVASKAAELLLGKNNPLVRSYTDPNAHVIIINAAKADIAPKRSLTKFYKWYSGYPSGLRHKNLEKVTQDNPVYPIEHAIKGMLPKNTRGRNAFTHLRVFAGAEHPHEAQKPESIDITTYTL